MVDVTGKETTLALSRAQAVVHTRRCIDLIMDADLPKGDATGGSGFAGIMAAKKTWETYPVPSHPLGKITVDFEPDAEAGTLRVITLVKTKGVTGVEMEALSAVSTARWTVYDMIKAVDAGGYHRY